MTTVMYVVGVLVFVIGLAVSVGLHEFGHLVPGKLFGVKVTQYFVGFGPTLWSRRIGETEYGVKAIPLGGYVKLIGMIPPSHDVGRPEDRAAEDAREDRADGGAGTRTGRSRTGIFSQLVDDARTAENDLVGEGDENRLFYRLSWWKKVVVMVSGVMTNLVIAFLLFAFVFMGRGVEVASTTVRDVSQCVIAVTKANPDGTRPCGKADPEAPAKRAGIRPGDRIVAFNGKPITEWSQVQRAIQDNGGDRATIVVRRDGQDVTLSTRTTVSPRLDPAGSRKITRVGFLGVIPTQERQRQDVGFVVTTMATGTWQTVQAIATLPVKVYHAGRAGLGLEKRDQNGPMSVVGAGRLAGEATAQAPTLTDGVFFVLTLLGGLNLFLAMLNLVPLLPLDGGQVAGALYEALRRAVAKVRRRPDPGFVDIARLLPIGYVMAGVILVVSVVLIFADIVAPVTLS